MPQLKSGRHIALIAKPFIEAITTGSDENKSFAIMTVRLKIQTPAQLRDYINISYFKEGEGIPPDAPAYYSGFNVGEILAGKADWSQAEIDEFRAWLDTNPQIDGWLQKQFDAIDSAIKNNAVWQSPLWMED